MQISDLDNQLNSIFSFDQYKDFALNGLQIGLLTQPINTIALAVDSNLDTIYKALEVQADLLLVHHGIFFGALKNLTDFNYKKVSLFIKNQLSLYAIHIPLDAHIEYGNNALLAKQFYLSNIQPFFLHENMPIGVIANSSNITETIEMIQQHYNIKESLVLKTNTIPNKTTYNIGILSGQLSSSFFKQSIGHCDLIITGETNLAVYNEALDYKIPIICLGHHHSEKIGIKHLAKLIDSNTESLKFHFIEDNKPI